MKMSLGGSEPFIEMGMLSRSGGKTDLIQWAGVNSSRDNMERAYHTYINVPNNVDLVDYAKISEVLNLQSHIRYKFIFLYDGDKYMTYYLYFMEYTT